MVYIHSVLNKSIIRARHKADHQQLEDQPISLLIGLFMIIEQRVLLIHRLSILSTSLYLIHQ